MVMNNADQSRTVELNLADTPVARTQSSTTLMGSGDAEVTNGPTLRVSVAPRSMGIYQLN
jgi:hypothetical protein